MFPCVIKSSGFHCAKHEVTSYILYLYDVIKVKTAFVVVVLTPLDSNYLSDVIKIT